MRYTKRRYVGLDGLVRREYEEYDPVECPYCGARLVNRRALKRHVIMWHPEHIRDL